jgi:phenylalanyl-tRNA synthetase alpha chain
MKHISKEQLQKSLSIEDLSAKEGHVLNILVNKIKTALYSKYGIEAKLEKGNPVVKKSDNFSRLGYKDNEVSMGERYTRYVDDENILRTQMTSLIPNLLTEYSKNPKDESLWICPGLVYRRDVIDKTHVGEPHQMDIWYLKKGKTNRTDLVELVDLVVGTVGEILNTKLEYRLNETSHHYTEDGIEVEVLYNGKWLEILECGLSGHKLLKESGLNPKEYSGLALGMGLDRLAMLAKKITDIRVFRSEDERIKSQMYNLKKYKEVSKQPAIKRDFSIAVSTETVFEELCEKIQNELGESAEIIEEVTVKAETPYNKLPEVAQKKLGMNESQSNWLLSITLRHPSRTIEGSEANSVYEDLYSKLHEGEVGYFTLGK